MPKTVVNVPALYSALDAERQARGWSWRRLANDVGVSPSLFSRLANDMRPDADGFATLVRWLRMPAETFMGDDGAIASDEEPELTAQLAPLLRARKDLSNADVEYLEEVIRATLRRAKADRS